MKVSRVKRKTQLITGVLTLIIAGCAAGSPSGLNNIPTSDVAPEKVLVLQTWGDFADNNYPVGMAGFKYGLIKGVEVGLDQKLQKGDEGALTFQAKWQWQIPGLTSVMPLVGVANISDDRDKTGEVDPYLVLTLDAGISRFHLGYSFQDDNQAVFAGIDKTFKVAERDLVLRGDVRQVSDGDDLLGSVGVLHVLPYNFVFEGWGSFPSNSDSDESVTIKLNYVISF